MGLIKNEFFGKKRYWLSVILVLIIFLGVFSAVAYQNLSTPKYINKKESIELYSRKSWYDYRATIEKENPIWPVGTRLDNQPIYFLKLAPNLNGTFYFQLSSTSPTELTANYQLKRILSSSGKDVIYWSKERVISSGEGKNEFRSDFQLNMTEIEKEIKETKEGIDFYGGDIELKVIASVSYQGKIGNEKISEQKEFPLVVKPSRSYYQISSKPSEETVKKEIIQKLTVPHSSSEKATLLAFPMILFLAIIGLVMVKWRYTPLTEKEIEETRKEKEYQKFKGQISIGEYPRDLKKQLKQEIRMKSLKDIVELAIDMDKRVIYDPLIGVYFVIDSDILYYYQFGHYQFGEEE